MFIQIKHDHYRGVTINNVLELHLNTGEKELLLEGITEATVTANGDLLHIVALQGSKQAWYYRGSGPLERRSLELATDYAGGLRLIGDGVGNCHLFYFTSPAPGKSAHLRHQIIGEKESQQPMLVSTNVFGEKSSFSATWHKDQYLHVVYCSQRGQQLLYRVFNLEQGLWSGAVPFANENCSLPQFFNGEKLYLFWLENNKKTVLNLKEKNGSWSKATTLSNQDEHGGSLGFLLEGGEGFVVWSEGNRFFKVPLGDWDKREEVIRDDFEYGLIVQGGIVLPSYIRRDPLPAEQEAAPSTKGQPIEVKVEDGEERKEELRKKQEEEQRKAQTAFVETAFRTLHEWEQFRAEIKAWQSQFTPPKPVKPVDLSPLTSRLERLERRLYNLQQAQEKPDELVKLGGELRLIRRELGNVEHRLVILEERTQSRRKTSLLRRVLRRL